MQLKRGAKLLTIVGLTTKHADSRVTFISNTFVTYDYLSELIHPSLFSTLVLLYMQSVCFVRPFDWYIQESETRTCVQQSEIKNENNYMRKLILKKLRLFTIANQYPTITLLLSNQ